MSDEEYKKKIKRESLIQMAMERIPQHMGIQPWQTVYLDYNEEEKEADPKKCYE